MEGHDHTLYIDGCSAQNERHYLEHRVAVLETYAAELKEQNRRLRKRNMELRDALDEDLYW